MGNADRRASLLRQLHVLNRRYIDFILEHDTPGCDFLPQLRMLDSAALHELCASPFTLYALPFASDTHWWHPRFEALRAVWPAAERDAATELVAMTLLLAWHAVHKDAASARMFFGLSSGAFEFFRSADVATLTKAVEPTVRELRPRWPANPHFWPDLIRCAGRDPSRMQAARLLGIQLLAIELCGDRLPQPRARRRVELQPPPPLLQPR